MKKFLTTVAVVTGATLVLAACGGGGSDDEESPNGNIKGAESSAPASKTPAGTDEKAADRPQIKLPEDLTLVFESFDNTGDKAKDAVLADLAGRIRAMDAAKVEGSTTTDAVTFYTHPLAMEGARRSLKFYADKGYSLTGTFRYFRPEVTVGGKSAEVRYCGDESKGFGKERSTGKVLRTPVSENSYVQYIARLRLGAEGVWQTADMSTDRGAEQCQP